MKFLPQLFITRQKTADKFVLKQMTHPVQGVTANFAVGFFLNFYVTLQHINLKIDPDDLQALSYATFKA